MNNPDTLPGQPIPDEILIWATPDQLMAMAFACTIAGNQRAVAQITNQQLQRIGLVSWPTAPPTDYEQKRRKGRR